MGIVPPKKILIIRLSSFGDILLATPLIRALRVKFPPARLDFVVKANFAELLRYHPAIDNLHELPAEAGWPELRALGRRLRDMRYDVVFDIHKNFRSRYLACAARPPRILAHRKHVFRRWIFVNTKINLMKTVPPIGRRYLNAAMPLGIAAARAPGKGQRLELFWSDKEEQEAEIALHAHGWQPHVNLIGLAPGAGYFTKRWPPEYFGQLAAGLARLGNQVVLLGGPQDAGFAKIIEHAMGGIAAPAPQQGTPFHARRKKMPINLVGEISLLAAAAVIKRCRMLIANDSGPMHIAEAVGTPLVAIFGSTVRELGFFPRNASSHAIENQGLSCRPCSHLGHDRCPRGHFRCMREILPEEVLAMAKKMLSSANLHEPQTSIVESA
jgi:heptosyltransferase-2